MIKKELKTIKAKLVNGPNRYGNLSPEEIIAYCRFALGGYIVGKSKFVYPDAQSQARYVDGELLLKYLSTIKDRDGNKAASDELRRIESCGYLYTYRVGDREFLCTSEGKTYLEKNAKNFL